MIQNFSHKHALLIAQCVCRNSPPGKRSSLFYPPYPHRHKFSTEANFRGSYFYLLDIDWSCLGWSNILALLSSTVFHLSRSSWGNRWKNDERLEGGGKCLSLFAAFPPRPRQTAPVTYLDSSTGSSWPTNFVIRKTSAPHCNINSFLFRGNALFRCWPTKVTTFSELHKCQHSNAWVTTIPKSWLCPQNESTNFF